MIRFLLLSAGTNACFHVAKTLKKEFGEAFYLIGADINPACLVSTSVYLDKFYQVPLSSDPSYYDKVIKICESEQVQVLLPSFDRDQMLFYPENPDLQRLNVRSLGTSRDAFAIYQDKEHMAQFLKENDFPVPQFYALKDVLADRDYFVKPVKGVGSVGARLMRGADILGLSDEDVIIQEVCENPEITLECFFHGGRLSTVARERCAAKCGVCVKARVYHDSALESIAQRFVRCVKTPMYFNLQFMRNSRGKYVITDVNLRLAGGMSISCAAGWNEVSAIAKVLTGKDETDVFGTLKPVAGAKYVCRVYEDVITKAERPVVAFDWDGTLLDSRMRHKIVMDDILSEHNIDIDTTDLVAFKRTGRNNVDFLISKGVEEAAAIAIQKEWVARIENSRYLQADVLYPDAKEVLARHKDSDCILITARSNEEALHEQVKQVGLQDAFTQIFVVKPGKTASEQKAAVLREQNAQFFVGDTTSDYRAARLANIPFKYRKDGFHELSIVE